MLSSAWLNVNTDSAHNKLNIRFAKVIINLLHERKRSRFTIFTVSQKHTGALLELCTPCYQTLIKIFEHSYSNGEDKYFILDYLTCLQLLHCMALPSHMILPR